MERLQIHNSQIILRFVLWVSVDMERLPNLYLRKRWRSSFSLNEKKRKEKKGNKTNLGQLSFMFISIKFNKDIDMICYIFLFFIFHRKMKTAFSSSSQPWISFFNWVVRSLNILLLASKILFIVCFPSRYIFSASINRLTPHNMYSIYNVPSR